MPGLESANAVIDRMENHVKGVRLSVEGKPRITELIAGVSDALDDLVEQIESLASLPDEKLNEIQAIIDESLDPAFSEVDTLIERVGTVADEALDEVTEVMDDAGKTVIESAEALGKHLDELLIDEFLVSLEERMAEIESLLDATEQAMTDFKVNIGEGFGRVTDTIEGINAQIESVRPILNNVRTLLG